MLSLMIRAVISAVSQELVCVEILKIASLWAKWPLLCKIPLSAVLPVPFTAR